MYKESFSDKVRYWTYENKNFLVFMAIVAYGVSFYMISTPTFMVFIPPAVSFLLFVFIIYRTIKKNYVSSGFLGFCMFYFSLIAIGNYKIYDNYAKQYVPGHQSEVVTTYTEDNLMTEQDEYAETDIIVPTGPVDEFVLVFLNYYSFALIGSFFWLIYLMDKSPQD